MKLFLSIISFLIGFYSVLPAQARTFNALSDSFAVYVKGSLDTVSYDNTLVSDSKGNGVLLDSVGPNKISGELGLFFARPMGNVRLGLEYLRPGDLEAKQGLRGSDDLHLYNLTSEVSILSPKVIVEVNLKYWPAARLFVSAGYGYAMLTGRNEYALTEAGRDHFSMTSFDEQLSGNTSLIEGSVGYENILADMTTFVFEAGYRSLVFESIEYKKSTTTFQGSVGGGQAAKNMDGKARSLDLSGIFVALSFRFWM